jgi:TonB family protein
MAPTPLALLIYSAQILLVVGIATIALSLCRLSPPAARLAFWRAVGVLCLTLPLLSATRAAAPNAAVVFGAAAIERAATVTAAPLFGASGTLVLWGWAAGAAARLGWLVLGSARLRQIRRRSAPAALSDFEALRMAIAPRAAFRWSDELTQPVTFGARRPLVFLPRQFARLDSEAQRAVVCHELLHVSRRDWLWILVEEHLRALFWFHPAAWWVLEQVHLSREQLIDQLVVARTASRKAYMAALIRFADSATLVSPSMAFLRRRHLASRLRQLSKESRMSWKRLILTTAALVGVIAGATRVVVSTLPLEIPAPGQQSRGPARLEIRLAETAPSADLIDARVSGSDQRIYLHPTVIATDADVTAARVIDSGQSRFSVAVTFNESGSARLASATRAHIGKPAAIVLDGRVIAAPVLRAPISGSAVISGDFTRSQADEIAAALTPAASSPASGRGPNRGASQPLSSKGPGVSLPVPVREVKPVYTQAAMANHIQGEVQMSVVVLPDGTVDEVIVTRSLDAVYGLDQQAVDAIKQWRFEPGTKDGVSVAVRVDIQMIFTLK